MLASLAVTIEIRAVTEEELDAYMEACFVAFGDEARDGEADRIRQGIGLERTRAAFEGSRIVGTSGAYGLQMAVPGGADLATAGLTRVTVAATHRRRGILNAMMDAHFDDAVANGEALSALWASEVAIYGRYGYGQVGQNVAIECKAPIANLRPPEELDSLSFVSIDEAEELFPAIRERGRVERPGHFRRSVPWWKLRILPDHEWERHGGSPRRHVVARRDGEPVGYAMYRQHRKWTENDIPDGNIEVVEIQGVDARAEHNLWWYLCNIDLFPNLSTWTQPPDSMLPWLARNPRGIRQLMTDGIHLRVLDIETALSSRRYDRGGELVFSTEDPQRPALTGTYRLSVDDEGVAACTRSDDEPSVKISPYGLGTLYLGSTPIAALAAGGHVIADEPTLNALRRLFTWAVAPWCDEGF